VTIHNQVIVGKTRGLASNDHRGERANDDHALAKRLHVLAPEKA
jgi:hypothetical protein